MSMTRPCTKCRIENHASRTRSVVGRVVSPLGATKRRPRRASAMMRMLSGLDLGPHLAAQLLSCPVALGDESRCAPSGQELTFLSERRQYRGADQERAWNRAAHGLCGKAEVAGLLDRPQRLHGLRAGARAAQVNTVDFASFA